MQRGVGRVEEEVERQVPQPPQDAQQQDAAALPKTALEAGLQKEAPAIFLAEEGQEGEEKVGDQKQHEKVGRGAGPIAKVSAQLACGQHAEEDRGRPQGQKQQQAAQRRQKAAMPAQAGGFAGGLFLRQQQDPGQHAANDDHHIAGHGPGGAAGSRRAEAADRQHGCGQQVAEEKAAGQLRLALRGE